MFDHSAALSLAAMDRWQALIVASTFLATAFGETRVTAEDAPRGVIQLRVSSGHGALTREILRQGFAATARDEFGFITRDQYLREPTVSQPHVRPVTILVSDGGAVPSSLRIQYRNSTRPTLATLRFPEHDEKFLEANLQRVEEYSRTEFHRILSELGLSTFKVPAHAAPELRNDIAQLDIVSQFCELRKLHSALQVNPQSPQVLALLTARYALLGSLVENHWGAEAKIFKARGLVYGERALRVAPTDVQVAWSRALARQLSGMDWLAQEELKRAQSLGPAAEIPAWGKSLSAWIGWDEAALAECAKRQEPLAGYMRLLTVELCGSAAQLAPAVTDVMLASPDCYRAASILADGRELGLRRTVGEVQLAQFLEAFPRLLGNVEGLPANVAGAVRKAANAQELHDRMTATVELIRALREAPPEQDGLEPSLATLATLAENLNFSHVLQAVRTERDFLRRDASATAARLKDLIQDHPAKAVLGVYISDPAVAREELGKAARAINDLPTTDAALPAILSWRSLDAKEQLQIEDVARSQRDFTVPDVLRSIDDGSRIPQTPAMVEALQRMSPRCPGVIAAVIRHNPDTVGPRLAEWRNSTNALVLRMIAGYDERAAAWDPQLDELAERSILRWMEFDPSYPASELLANHYWTRNQLDRYREVMLDSLKLPDLGLHEARVCEKIALSYFPDGRYLEARPYAIRAASSGSAWGLDVAGQTLESLEEWTESERMFRAKSMSYRSGELDWYLWCRRTGRGDLNAAREFLSLTIERKSAAQRAQDYTAAAFAQLEGDHELALTRWREVISHNSWDVEARLSAALLCRKLGREPEFESYIRDLANLSDVRHGGLPLLCDLWRRTGRLQSATEADLRFACTINPATGASTGCALSLGRWYLLDNRKEQALPWLRVAAASPHRTLGQCMAILELRALNEPAPPCDSMN